MSQPSLPLPGKYAKRTDLPAQGAKKLPDAAYGEQKDFQDIQGGAPMAKATPSPISEVIPFGAPTNRPDEPVTAGAASGPGVGTEALGIKSVADQQVSDLDVIAKYMPAMIMFADSPQSSGTMKAFVKYLRSQTE